MASGGMIGKIEHFNSKQSVWDVYLERLELLFVVNDVTGDTDKAPLLLNFLGPEAYMTLRNLLAPTKPSTATYKTLVDTLTNHQSH